MKSSCPKLYLVPELSAQDEPQMASGAARAENDVKSDPVVSDS